ncbi:hypothetical protein GCM10017750_14630 [Streptomyces racemochromogenes]
MSSPRSPSRFLRPGRSCVREVDGGGGFLPAGAAGAGLRVVTVGVLSRLLDAGYGD